MLEITVPGVTKIGEYFYQTDQIGDISCTVVQGSKNGCFDGTAPERQRDFNKLLCYHQIEDCSMQVGRTASTEENMIRMTDKSRNKVSSTNGLCTVHLINSQSLSGQLWICRPVFNKVFNVHELTLISEQQQTRQPPPPPQIQLQKGHALRVQAKCQDTSRPEGAGLDTASADEAHDQDGLILIAAVRVRKVVHMQHLNEKDLVAAAVALNVVDASSNTTCSDSGAANKVQNVCRSGCVSTTDSTKQEMFKLNKTTVILEVYDVSNRSSHRDNNQDSEVEDESLNMIGMCSSSPFQKSRGIMLKYVRDKMLEHCNAENTKRLQEAELDLPDYLKMVNMFANLRDIVLREDNGHRVYMDKQKESIEAEIIKCRLESDLDQETRQIRGTATGQMFGNSKTVMLADITSASLCIVSARSSPTMQDQWVNIRLGAAHVVDAGDEERDYRSSSVSNWHDVLVLHGKKQLWERTHKSIHAGQDLDDEDNLFPELDSSSDSSSFKYEYTTSYSSGTRRGCGKGERSSDCEDRTNYLLLEPTSGGEGEGAARRETRAHYYKRTAPRRRTRRGSGVSGEALGLASYADVPVPPGREPSRARTMAGRSRRRSYGRIATSMDGMGRRIREAGAERSARESGLGATSA